MSPLQSNLSCCSTFRLFDELQWVTNTRRTIEADHLEDDGETSISIFNVPKALMSTDPDSYAPQQLSLGPYHFSRLELHDMDTYKFSAAKRSQDLLQSLKFQDLVEQLMKLESKIRACYNKYLNLNSETLAWMMAIDASFLLEFLQVYALRDPKMLSEVSSGMPHFLEYSYRKSSCNAILRDIVMLENQIPLFTLRKVLEFRFLSLESTDDMLYSMLMGSCKELSPFKKMVRLPVARVSEHAHLLDFLYHIIVPKVEESVNIPEEVRDHTKATQENEEPSVGSTYMKQLLIEIWNLFSNLNIDPARFLKKLLESAPVAVILKLPWSILSNVLGFGSAKQPDAFSESQSVCSSIDQPPLVEEITIPSVTQLSKCGVRFVPSKGSISTINFDKKTCTFYLPTVSLDVNSDVVLRNLVAYEASNASGPMVFTRYTELMNGIIDTEEDAKILRERGIILNHLKNDEEVANVWNGMSRSIRLTKVPFMDKVIEDVNKYHDGLFKVKVEKFMKQYVFSSWKLLILLASILFLLLAFLQALCSVYDCVRLFHIHY
ncbi:putative UPF0481 protein At3g02645 [Populus nigra]|uniref:putative UPF0481 protein At3g02645 n=1 Tax=Populus nigra TaxID=3691 RepID=UPI002B27B442|nr:putative UPF0481 protein At3g02645 [Populus nigra]